MSDKKSNDSRRKLLKSLAVGSSAVVAGKTLPESWTKPVINSVMLPVHASTTDDTGSGGPEVTTTVTPTTTQGCCLIEQTYCTSLGNQQGHLEIDVASNGNITVRVYADGTDILTDTILCTGGTFNASDNNHTVTGTVGCAAASISGTASFFGGNPIQYTATVDGCNPA